MHGENGAELFTKCVCTCMRCMHGRMQPQVTEAAAAPPPPPLAGSVPKARPALPSIKPHQQSRAAEAHSNRWPDTDPRSAAAASALPRNGGRWAYERDQNPPMPQQQQQGIQQQVGAARLLRGNYCRTGAIPIPLNRHHHLTCMHLNYNPT